MVTSCHQSLRLRLLLTVRARPLHCRTPGLHVHHSHHCTSTKTPPECHRGTDPPSLSLYIRFPPSITPICRIINDLVRNNPNTLRPHHRSETNPTASPASTILGDSPQHQVLLPKQPPRSRRLKPIPGSISSQGSRPRSSLPLLESCPRWRHRPTVWSRPCGGKASAESCLLLSVWSRAQKLSWIRMARAQHHSWDRAPAGLDTYSLLCYLSIAQVHTSCN